MRPVTPFEKVLLDTGNANSIALFVLDRPPDLETVLAELHSACRRLQRMRSVVRRGPLWPVRRPVPVRLQDHVTVIEGELSRHDLELLVSAAAGMSFTADRPPWRMVVINPGPGVGGLHGLLIHYCHTIADGQRMNRLVCRMAARSTPEDAEATRGTLPSIRREAWPSEASRRTSSTVAFLDLAAAPGHRLTPRAVVAAFASALHRKAGFSPSARRRGTALEVIADTRKLAGEEGNHILFRSIGMEEAVRVDTTLVYRLIALTGPWRFGWGALLPRFALRPLLAFWYDQFDLFLSFLPGARRPFFLGGGLVREIWPVAPMLADMPACVTVYQGLGGAFATVQTGRAAAVSPHRLAALAAEALDEMRSAAATFADP